MERTPRFLLDNQGAGIVAGGDTISFFEKYDRTGKPIAVPSYKRLYLNQKGDVIHEEVKRQNMTSWDLCYYLLRANYDRVESEYLDDGGKLPKVRESDGKVDYRYGCTVTDIIDEGDFVRVKFKRVGEDGVEFEDEVQSKLVVAADGELVLPRMISMMKLTTTGPSSTVRKILEPQVERTYAGYVSIRGTVPESEASQASLDVFRERFCFFHAPGTQNLTYTIAGPNGNTNPGHRLLNFVWYANFPEGSPELEQLMTDQDGRRRHVTIPPGKIAWNAWEMLKSKADDTLSPQMAEMAHKTRSPFVQCITDVISPKNLYMGDKVVLIGDALAGFRPHPAASTSQAAFNVMSLVEWLEGGIERKEFVRRTMEFARMMQNRGVEMGRRSQFEDLGVGEHIRDRNLASTKRGDDVYPEWTREGLEEI